MAVATPLLERKTESEEKNGYGYSEVMTEDERHNSKISENYARLINSDYSIRDLRGESRTENVVEDASYEAPRAACSVRNAATVAPAAYVSPSAATAPAPTTARTPYYVDSARTSSDLFRADSAINKKLFENKTKVVAEQETDDEDNEDLRPTQTTIQYKTQGVHRTTEEGKISNNTGSERHTILSKKEKVVIAVVISVIVALFVMIIVNSTIISNLNSDLNALQTTLSDTRTVFKNVNDRLDDVKDNLLDSVMEYVEENGGVINSIGE